MNFIAMVLRKKQKTYLTHLIFRLQEELMVIAGDVARVDKQLKGEANGESTELLQENVGVWR